MCGIMRAYVWHNEGICVGRVWPTIFEDGEASFATSLSNVSEVCDAERGFFSADAEDALYLFQ
jgi:hypothetical protein